MWKIIVPTYLEYAAAFTQRLLLWGFALGCYTVKTYWQENCSFAAGLRFAETDAASNSGCQLFGRTRVDIFFAAVSIGVYCHRRDAHQEE